MEGWFRCLNADDYSPLISYTGVRAAGVPRGLKLNCNVVNISLFPTLARSWREQTSGMTGPNADYKHLTALEGSMAGPSVSL